MRKFTRRIAITVAAVAMTAGLVAGTAPTAQAKDSGWGCGGPCRVAH